MNSDTLLRRENAKLHRKIVRLEVAHQSQRNRIAALEKEIKKLAPILREKNHFDGLKALRDSPELLQATKRMIAQVEEAAAERRSPK